MLPLAALAGALLAAGCGGSEDETSGAAEWASSVCSTMTTWATSVSTATASLQGGNLSENSLEAAVEDITDATKTLADELQDVGKPDTEDGQQAKDLLDQLGDEVRSGVQALEDDVASASGGGGILTAVSATLATMSSEVGGIVDQLQQLDPAGELDDALNDAEECSSLRSGG